MCIVRLKDVNLVYRVKKAIQIKDYLFPRTRKPNVSRTDCGVHALKDINITISEGDRLGLIGPNGAGKSSFLKLIAGIYPPVYGELFVDGHIACLFELATGFEMEANGWENIYLRGLMLGETPKSIKGKMEEIAEFSGLGDYLEMPVKYYSSGMFIRLAFSVSTAIKPEILLLDEVFAAGDACFLEKAQQRLRTLMDNANILVYATHDMNSLTEFCNKCIWMQEGEIKMYGDAGEVSEAYLRTAGVNIL